MKAQELRIGNYVNVPNESQCPFRIDAFECLSESFIKVAQDVFISEKKVHSLTWYGKDIAPILLTEEWLIKFGFDRRGYTSSNGSKLVLHHKEPMYPNGRIYYNSWCIKNELPQYVHQLQNLYFALTGEELTLKENNNGK